MEEEFVSSVYITILIDDIKRKLKSPIIRNLNPLINILTKYNRSQIRKKKKKMANKNSTNKISIPISRKRDRHGRLGLRKLCIFLIGPGIQFSRFTVKRPRFTVVASIIIRFVRESNPSRFLRRTLQLTS